MLTLLSGRYQRFGEPHATILNVGQSEHATPKVNNYLHASDHLPTDTLLHPIRKSLSATLL
jgi:hypothetical protein